MKKVILIIAIALVSISTYSQRMSNSEPIDSLHNVSIKSKIPLKYSSRENKTDTIYVAMESWSYLPAKKTAVGFLKEYVKKNDKFSEIGSSRVLFSKSEINNAFAALNVTLTPTSNFTNFLEDYLVKSLIKEIKKTLDDSGNTIYGALPTNWQINK